MVDAVLVAWSLLAGLGAGIASGLFGVGGGVVMVPAILYLIPGTDFHSAKAASLLAMAVSTAVGVHSHHKHGNVDVSRGLVLGGTGVLGAAAGTFLAQSVSGRALSVGFAVLLGATGLRLAVGAQPEPRALGRRAALALTAAVGLAGGLIAGFFGVGGGIIMVPALVLTGVGMHLAVGTSLVAVLVNAWSATAVNLALGYAAFLVAVGVPFALGGVAGVRAGAALAVRVQADRLRRAFGAFLAVIAAYMAFDAL